MDTRTHAHIRHSMLAVLAALLLALVVAAPVAADADLDRSNPDDGDVLAAPPTEVTLRFTAGLDASKSSFRLLGPNGDTEVARGTPAEDGTKTMKVDGLALAPGEYTVRWTSAALDGHLVRGRLTFTVSEPTPAPATPTAAPTEAPSAAASEAPVTVAPTEAPATAVPTPAPSADTSPAASSGTDVVIPIVAALALVAVIGFLVLRRNRAA